MHSVSNTRIIDQIDNVVLVDFRREPDPPAPRFPGASGVRPLDCPQASTGIGGFGPERQFC